MDSACKSGIYAITNVVTGKQYIGSAKDFAQRFHQHRYNLNQRCHANVHLQRAWLKYGADAFTFTTLEYVVDQDQLDVREQAWIDIVPRALRYNIRLEAQSNRGLKHSLETRAKFSAQRLGRKMSPEVCAANSQRQRGKVISREQRQRISATLQGCKHGAERRANISQGMRGHVISVETRAKISRALTGHSCSEETRAKISIPHKGKVLSEEHRAKIAAARHGDKRGPMSDEHKAKISAGRKRQLAEKVSIQREETS